MVSKQNKNTSFTGDDFQFDVILKVIRINERFFALGFVKGLYSPYVVWECIEGDAYYNEQYFVDKIQAVRHLYIRAKNYLDHISETDTSNAKLEDSSIWCGATRDEWAELYECAICD